MNTSLPTVNKITKTIEAGHLVFFFKEFSNVIVPYKCLIQKSRNHNRYKVKIDAMSFQSQPYSLYKTEALHFITFIKVSHVLN